MRIEREMANSQEPGALTRMRGAAAFERRKSYQGYYVLPLLLLVAMIAPHGTRPQAAAPAAQPAAPPPRVVYKQVFQHLVFLDYQANIADQHGQNGNALRNYYQTHATLTAPEAALLKSTAHDAVAALKPIDQQIQTEVTIFRSQFAGGKWPRGKPLPPPPPVLHTLQAAKDKVILDHLATIQNGFGTARFQHLDSFVQAAIAPHITLAAAPALAAAKAGSKTADQGKTLRQLPPVPWLQ